MKFIASSSVLHKSLLTISGVIASNPILPILENFLFYIEETTLHVTATDLQTTMTVQVPIDSPDMGAIAIPAKLLLDTLKSFPEQPITVVIEPDHRVTILTDNGRFKLTGEDAMDFPKVPTVANVQEVAISSDALLSAISYTAFAVSKDELRPALNGVHVSFSGEVATFAATDGHRLVRYRRGDIKGLADTSLILPHKALTLLKTALPEGVEVAVRLSYANASFTFGANQLICRLIDERFPDFESAIPTDNTNVLTIGRTDLINSLKRVMIYANKKTNHIRLSLLGNSLTIAAEVMDYAKEADEKLFCEYDGSPLDIGFNAKLLIENLNSLHSKIVSIALSTPNRGGILTPSEVEDSEEVLMLIMPVLLNTVHAVEA